MNNNKKAILIDNPFLTQASFKGFAHKSEDEKLLEDVLRPEMEKLQLFTKMLQRNATLKKARLSTTTK